MKKFSILKSALLCSVFLLGTAAGNNSKAQTAQSPSDCKTGCTSNDVQILRAYLVDPVTLQRLSGSFSCSGTASVKLALELTTNTPRVGVVIYANIKNFTGGTVGATLVTKKECFSTVLNQPTNRVVFSGAFGWPCGTPIVLTDVFLGWGTGNTDFCQANAAFRCPGTPSKCYQLPPGQYIAIEIPTAQNISRSRCPDAAGGSTATFDLTALNGTVSNNAANVTVSWYSNPALTTPISTPGAYSTTGTTAYAKVANNTDPNVYSTATVTLTVLAGPVLSITNPAGVCAPGTADITAAAVTSGSTLPAGTSLSYWTNSGATTSFTTPGVAGAGTYYIKATTSTTPACADIKAVTVTVNAKPDAPALCAVQPSMCGPATGTLTVTSPTGSSYEYSIDNGQHWQSGTTFSNIAPSSNPSIIVRSGGSCVSAAASCDNAGTCAPAARMTTATVNDEKRAVTAPTDDALSVKVYPNPFRNTVNFIFTAPISGQVSLEVYDSKGRQLAATNYGNVAAGTTRVLSYSPHRKISALEFYRLRVGGRMVSGKMIQIE